MPNYAMKIGFIFLILAVLFPQGAVAKDIFVPDDYATIGEAMDVASLGDTVYVKPGTYNERIEIGEGVN
ncbi:MAG: hypothetical protein JSV01_06090, partial [Desulfobacterales bacterium]